MELSRRRLIENRDTLSLNSRPEIQELQNEVNSMNDFERFLKMLNQYAVDYPTFPVERRHSHLIQILAECEAVLWECRAATTGRQVFGTHMVFRETFLQIQRRLLQYLIRKSPILGFLMSQNIHHHM